MLKKYFPDESYNRIPCGLVAFRDNEDLDIVYANERYYSDFSNGNTETLNIIKEDRKFTIGLRDKLKDVDSVEVNYRCRNKGDKQGRVCMSVSRFAGGVMLGTLWDVTEHYNLLQELKDEQEKYAVVLKFARNIIFINNIKEDFLELYIPAPDTNLIGHIKLTKGKDTLIKRAIWREDRKFFMDNIYNTKEESLSARMKIGDEKSFKWYRAHRKFVHDKQGELVSVYGVISNIEDEKKHEKELKEKIEMDPALNVYNRNAAVDRINEYLRKHPDRRDYALMVMDIDDFKQVNDTYGHLYGDAVIEMAANALNKVIGSKGIVGRYGGDEFFAFVKEITDEEICQKADGILEAFRNFQTANDECINCSVGIALGNMCEQTVTYKDLFEKADKALYHVKNTGKANWEIFDTEKMSEISGYAIAYEALDINSKELLESKDMMKVFLELSAGAKNSDNVIGRIMRYITERFKFDRMRVLYVDCKEDLIAIKHDWCTELDYRSFSSKSGYYVHSDIMRFYDYFEENPIFEIKTQNAEGFSLKFVREFEKNMKNEALYIANTTSDNYFYMFECVRFGNERPWRAEECQELNVATKILTMYVAQADKETENERLLKEQLDLDRKTGLYSMAKFYEQIGKLRKIAAENDETVAVVHTDFRNFLDFNMRFSQEEGDNVLIAFSDFIIGNNDPDTAIAAHIDGTEIFISALRIKKDNREFIEGIDAVNCEFCDIQNKKYPGANLLLKTGIYILKPEDVNGDALDKALLAKRRVKDYDKSFCALYED